MGVVEEADEADEDERARLVVRERVEGTTPRVRLMPSSA
jgi:hypothetical protein